MTSPASPIPSQPPVPCWSSPASSMLSPLGIYRKRTPHCCWVCRIHCFVLPQVSAFAAQPLYLSTAQHSVSLSPGHLHLPPKHLAYDCSIWDSVACMIPSVYCWQGHIRGTQTNTAKWISDRKVITSIVSISWRGVMGNCGIPCSSGVGRRNTLWQTRKPKRKCFSTKLLILHATV